MSTGERPIGGQEAIYAAKGKQSDTEASETIFQSAHQISGEVICTAFPPNPSPLMFRRSAPHYNKKNVYNAGMITA